MLVDRRDRWPDFTLAVPGFTFWRLAALPDGGVLALDRSKPQLGRVTGTPLQTGPVDTPDPGILRSCQENPTPPQMAATYPLPSGEAFVGFTATDQQFVLLSWAAASATNSASYLRLFDFDKGLGTPWKLNGILWPYSLAWLGDAKTVGAASTAAVNGGNGNDAAATSAVPAQSASSWGVTLRSSVNPSTPGQVVNLKATLSPASATGSVQFLDGATPLGTGTLSGGVGTLAVSTLAVGAHAITAIYSGDRNNAPSTSAVLTQTVSNPVSSVMLSSSANPSILGQPVTFTASVSSASATGSVTYFDGTAPLGSATVTGGVAKLTIALTAAGDPVLAQGIHFITAAYSGDAINPADTSAVLAQSVAQASVSLSSTANPSVGVLATGLNEALIFNLAEAGADLIPSGDTYVLSGINSGPFAHSQSLPPYYAAGKALLAPVALKSGGSATLSISSMAAGTHAITAVYSGDSKNAADTSTALVQTVSATTSSVTLSSSINPSKTGLAVTLQATVSPPTATGSVQFLDGTTALGTGTLSAGNSDAGRPFAGHGRALHHSSLWRRWEQSGGHFRGPGANRFADSFQRGAEFFGQPVGGEAGGDLQSAGFAEHGNRHRAVYGWRAIAAVTAALPEFARGLRLDGPKIAEHRGQRHLPGRVAPGIHGGRHASALLGRGVADVG